MLTRMFLTHESPDEALSAFTERRRARLNWVRNEHIAGIGSGLCLSTFGSRPPFCRDGLISARLSTVIQQTKARWPMLSKM